MCFASDVSFVAAGLLVPAGLYCVRRAVATQRRELVPLALVPVVFGVQQFVEGLVWVSLGRDLPEFTHWTVGAYLFFATAFWPAWLPVVVAAAEPARPRRRLLWGLACCGPLWFLLLYVPILSAGPSGLSVEVVERSLRYVGAEPYFALRIRELYLAACTVPGILTTRRRLFWPVGIVGVLAYFVAVYVRDATFVSVWCFYSAIISTMLAYAFASLSPAERSTQSTVPFVEPV